MIRETESTTVPAAKQTRSQQTTVAARGRLAVGWRLGSGLLAIILATLWGTAFMLTPDARGMGTHQQLGLPPCTFIVLWGIPCPACGMTTSWSYLAHGDFLAACRANAAGVFLGGLAIWGGFGAAWSAVTGRPLSNRTMWGIAIGMTTGLVMAVLLWLFRIYY